MKPERFIWFKDDNFLSIHDKLTNLVGKEVLSIKSQQKSYTIFEVDKIVENYFISMHDLISTEEDKMFNASNGEFNFSNVKTQKHLLWSFYIHFGFKDKDGCQHSMPYQFSVPRTEDKEANMKQKMFDPNHPFIFYEK